MASNEERLSTLEAKVENFARRFNQNDRDHEDIRRLQGRILSVSWSILVALAVGVGSYWIHTILDGMGP